MTKRLTPFIFFFFIIRFTYSQDFNFKSEEERLIFYKTGVRTAKQTWWFFDTCLKTPDLGYSYFRVFLEKENVWLKNIKKIDDNLLNGLIDLSLPHNESYTNEENIEFSPLYISDWMVVKDNYMYGGFSVRIKSFAEKQYFKRAGNFILPYGCINDDFIAFSRLTSEISDNKFLEEHFDGGSSSFMRYLKKHLSYPVYAREMGIQGSVTLNLHFDATGRPDEIKVIRGVGGGLNDIAKDAMFELKNNWIPYKDDLNKQPFDVRLPIQFIMN